MYSSATALDGTLSGISGSTSIRLAASTVPSTFGAAQAQEIGRRRAVRLVDAALVAGVDQRDVRQHGRATGRGDEHGVGLRGHQLRHLAGHRRVGAQESLARDDLDAAFCACALNTAYQLSP